MLILGQRDNDRLIVNIRELSYKKSTSTARCSLPQALDFYSVKDTKNVSINLDDRPCLDVDLRMPAGLVAPRVGSAGAGTVCR